MRMFYRMITPSSDEQIENGETFTVFSWENLQFKIKYEIYKEHINSVSLSSPQQLLSKDKLEDAMPFLVNYDKLKELLTKYGNDLLLILNFIKISVEYNIKLNIIQNLYNANINRNTKINTLQSEANSFNGTMKEMNDCLGIMENDFKNMNNNSNKDDKLWMLVKYGLHNRYNVYIELNEKKKVVIRLKSKLKNREVFIKEIIISINEYTELISKDVNGYMTIFSKETIAYVIDDNINNNNIINTNDNNHNNNNNYNCGDKHSSDIENVSSHSAKEVDIFFLKSYFNQRKKANNARNHKRNNHYLYTSNNNVIIESFRQQKESNTMEGCGNGNVFTDSNEGCVNKHKKKIVVKPIIKGKFNDIELSVATPNKLTQRTKETDKDEGLVMSHTRDINSNENLGNMNTIVTTSVMNGCGNMNSNNNNYMTISTKASNNVVVQHQRGFSFTKQQRPHSLQIENDRIDFSSYCCCKI